MEKFYVIYGCGVGTDTSEIIEAGDFDQAMEVVKELAYEWATSFGYETDLDHFGDLDQVGREWDEEEEDYLDTGEIYYYVESYVPEDHDDLL